MSASVLPIFANADPSANPTSLVDLVIYLNTLFETVNVQGGPFTPYVISSTTPQVSDQDKAWIQTDNNGRPLATKLFYNGNWRPVYRGKPGQITMFQGNPATYFDGTHLGIIGSEWDGWALCTATGNTNWGVPNLSDKFIVGGNAYSANWQSNVEDGATLKQSGGQPSVAIINNHLPYMPIFIHGYHYSAGAGMTPKHVHCDGDWSNINNPDPDLQTSFGADTTGQNGPPVPQVPVATVPPYYALAYAAFLGFVT